MKRGLLLVSLSGCGSVADQIPQDSNLISDVPRVDAPACITVPGVVARWTAEQNAVDTGSGYYNGAGQGINFAYGPGKHGYAFVLDPANHNQVSINDGDDALWPSASFSLEAWVKTTATGLGQVFTKSQCSLSCDAGTSNSYFSLSIGAGGVPQFEFRPEASQDMSTVKDAAMHINDGTWHHVVGVRDNAVSKMFLYVDGAERGVVNLPALQLGPMTNVDGSPDYATIGALRMMNTSWESYFDGAIDDVAIYSRALTSADVTSIYNAPDGFCMTLPASL